FVVILLNVLLEYWQWMTGFKPQSKFLPHLVMTGHLTLPTLRVNTSVGFWLKMVLWWEEEYAAAFNGPSGLLEQSNDEQVERTDSDEFDRGCGGIAVAKTSDPAECVNIVSDSASQLLEHLHTLSQEALDHADLTVLTGTLGAAALIKNCLWCYNEKIKNDDTKEAVQSSTKKTSRYMLQIRV
ncbi:hypothetical protein L9F63_026822, partial [Diploptera punctata]